MQNALLLFMSLLTALIVKSRQILADANFIFLEKHRRPIWTSFQYQIWTSVNKS